MLCSTLRQHVKLVRKGLDAVTPIVMPPKREGEPLSPDEARRFRAMVQDDLGRNDKPVPFGWVPSVVLLALIAVAAVVLWR